MPLQKKMEPFHIAVLDTIHQIAWTAADTGDVDWLNQEWYSYTGQRRSPGADRRSLMRQWLAAIHRDDFQRSRQALRDGIRSRVAFGVELRLRRADGVPTGFVLASRRSTMRTAARSVGSRSVPT